MKLEKWKDIRVRKISPARLKKIEEQVEKELLQMDRREPPTLCREDSPNGPGEPT
jgi:hypothetical protein